MQQIQLPLKSAPLNATANTGAYVNVQIKTSDDYYNSYDPDFGGSNATSFTASVGAKWAGALGNTFKISWCPSDRPSATLTGTVAWTQQLVLLQEQEHSLVTN